MEMVVYETYETEDVYDCMPEEVWSRIYVYLFQVKNFLGPRGPLGLPLSVRPPARGRKKSGSTVQLYKSTKEHCQPIRYCLVRVWWCLVVSGACLVVSGGV